MSGFDDFTRKLKSEHDAKTANYNAAEAEERRQRHAKWDQEISIIDLTAGPLLDEAKSACEAQGLRPVVKRNWETGRNSAPMVEFQLFGPKKRPLDESFYEVEGNKAVIQVENGKLRASVSKRAYESTVGINFVGYGAEGVGEALKLSITSYYDEIDPSRA